MKRVVFSIALLTLLVVISFASFAETSKGDPNYKHQNGSGSKKNVKGFMQSHNIIHPVDHFTI